MFYEILIEQYRTYTTYIEADNNKEAERIGRELLPALHSDTDDVIVQARELRGAPLRVVDKVGA